MTLPPFENSVSAGGVAARSDRGPWFQQPAVLVWIAAFAAWIGVSLLVRHRTEMVALLPVVVAMAAAGSLVLRLRRIEGALPYFEIGAFYAAVTIVYIAYPLVKYAIQGRGYVRGDSRILALAQNPWQVTVMGWWYALYLVAFCAAYALVRGKRPLEKSIEIERPGWPVIIAILSMLAGAKLFFLILGQNYDLTINRYVDAYLVIRRLPLFLRQLAAQVQGMSLALQMLLVVALTCGKRKSFTWLLIGSLAVISIDQFINPGARIQLFGVVIVALAARHLVVRRISFRAVAIAAVAGFLLLAVMAAMRTESRFRPASLRQMFVDNTEFEVIFGNAVDLKYLRHASGAFLTKPALYWSGIVSLIPQQFLSLRKDDPTAWYARTYYPEYYAYGGTWAFGVLAEGVVGFGWAEVAVRGLLMGFLFALLHRSLYRPRVPFFLFAGVLWITTFSYLTIRTGTLSLLMLITHRLLVTCLGVWILSEVLARLHPPVSRYLSRWSARRPVRGAGSE